MKNGPKENNAQENMKPGVISLSGFLGDDTRNLIQIIIDDDAAVKRLERSHSAIAERMIYFRDRGLEGLGEFIRVDGTFEVKVESVRGKIPSPFSDDQKIIGKTNITVRNLENGNSVTFTDMLIHLILTHGFYEGAGSPFRVAPADLITVLDVPPVPSGD